MQLDCKPKLWEDRTTLFIGHVVQNGMKSASVKSYISAIKKMLVNEGYKWNDKLILLSSLMRACSIQNDVLKLRLLISCSLLELITTSWNLNSQFKIIILIPDEFKGVRTVWLVGDNFVPCHTWPCT